jgi:hypothetical protein
MCQYFGTRSVRATLWLGGATNKIQRVNYEKSVAHVGVPAVQVPTLVLGVLH